MEGVKKAFGELLVWGVVISILLSGAVNIPLAVGVVTNKLTRVILVILTPNRPDTPIEGYPDSGR
jgi:hypothetical protein